MLFFATTNFGMNMIGKQKIEIKTRKEFWIPKIKRNIQRDIEINNQSMDDVWIVLRFTSLLNMNLMELDDTIFIILSNPQFNAKNKRDNQAYIQQRTEVV